MNRYRGSNSRSAHPKIFIWSHTKKAEIEYFLDFKHYLNSLLLMPDKNLCYTPQQLIEKIIQWKKKKIDDNDGDQVWCIFDIDDFHKEDHDGMLSAIASANKNGIKIAYINECFELWVLLHFQEVTSPPNRRDDYIDKIKKAYKEAGLGIFEKNQRCFNNLLRYQSVGIENAKRLVDFKNYEDINWPKVLSSEGNPSTSIHLLVEEIIKIHPDFD